MFDYAIHFDVTIDGQEHCLRKEIKSPVQLRPGDVVMVSVAMTSVKVAEIMGVETAKLSEEQVVQAAVNTIRKLVQDVGIVIEDFEVSEQIIVDLATLAMTVQRLLQNNPRPIEHKDAKQIYRKAL